MNNYCPTSSNDIVRLRIFKEYAKDHIDEATAQKFLSFLNRYEHPIKENDFGALLENYLALLAQKYGTYDEETFCSDLVFPEQRICVARDYIKATSVLKGDKVFKLASISGLEIDWQNLLAPQLLSKVELPYLVRADAEMICNYLSEKEYANICQVLEKI